MKGKYKVRVRNSRNTYEFELRRNVTVLLGNSGTGKTTLYDMIREYMDTGRSGSSWTEVTSVRETSITWMTAGTISSS